MEFKDEHRDGAGPFHFEFPRLGAFEGQLISKEQRQQLQEQIRGTRDALVDMLQHAEGCGALEGLDLVEELESAVKVLGRQNPVAGGLAEGVRSVAEGHGIEPPFSSGGAEITYRLVDHWTPEFRLTDSGVTEAFEGIDRTANVFHLLGCEELRNGELCPKTEAMISEYGWKQAMDDLQEVEKTARAVAAGDRPADRPAGDIMGWASGNGQAERNNHRLQTIVPRVEYGFRGWREHGVSPAWDREGYEEESDR